jgi:ABC-type multidrug transport system fused ATPase/permease subunit
MNMHRLGMAVEDSTSETLHINPNALGIMCVLSISGLMQLLLTRKGRPTDIIMAMTMAICGALTTSRTFLLLFVIMVVLFWLGQGGGIGQKLRFLLLIAMVGIAIITILNVFFPVAIENFAKRLSAADITGGRASLFTDYNQFLLECPDVLIFGVGTADFAYKVVTRYAVSFNVPHNGIQEAFVAWGLVGVAVLVSFLCAMLWNGRKAARQQSLLNYIPLVLLLAKIQAGQMLTSYYTMLAFVYCYLSLTQNFVQDQRLSLSRRRISKKRLDK